MLNYNLYKVLFPKHGNTTDECEDSIFCKFFSSNKEKIGLNIAIADGATESSFSKEWAIKLTHSFKSCKVPLSKNFLYTLPYLRTQFSHYIRDKVLPWYALEKVEKGSFSAFLGIHINLIEHKYEAIAIGDCCYFHIREDKLIQQSPLNNSNEFGNNPYLISSNPVNNLDIENFIVISSYELLKGDFLFLMSDALAHWFMKNNELEEHPWEILLGLKSDSVLDNNAFISWLKKNRMEKNIKNDDVVLAILEF